MPLLGGLGRWLGGHGRAIIAGLQEIGQSVASALRLGGVAGAEVEPAAVVREWGEVLVAEGRESEFAALLPGESPPIEWYETSDIPWDKPIAYTVSVYGRMRLGTKKYKAGQFGHTEYHVTVSRPLTTEEVLEEARAWLTGKDYSPMSEVFSAKVTGGSRRAGEEWRW